MPAVSEVDGPDFAHAIVHLLASGDDTTGGAPSKRRRVALAAQDQGRRRVSAKPVRGRRCLLLPGTTRPADVAAQVGAVLREQATVVVGPQMRGQRLQQWRGR